MTSSVGKQTVWAATESFYRRVLADERVSHFFKGTFARAVLMFSVESAVKIIFTGTREPVGFSSLWRERYGPADFIPADSLIRILKEKQSGFAAEAIVIDTSEMFHWEGPSDDEYLRRRTQAMTLETAVALVRSLRNLDSYVAMDDGRKWCSVPIILIFADTLFSDFSIPESLDATIVLSRGDVLSDVQKI